MLGFSFFGKHSWTVGLVETLSQGRRDSTIMRTEEHKPSSDSARKRPEWPKPLIYGYRLTKRVY